MRSIARNRPRQPSPSYHRVAQRSTLRPLARPFGASRSARRAECDLGFSRHFAACGHPASDDRDARDAPSGELFSSRLLRLVELVLVIRKDDERDPLDWAAVTEHLRSANALRFAYPAFTLVERLAPGTIDERALGARRCCTMRGARSRRMGCGGLGQRGRDMPA